MSGQSVLRCLVLIERRGGGALGNINTTHILTLDFSLGGGGRLCLINSAKQTRNDEMEPLKFWINSELLVTFFCTFDTNIETLSIYITNYKLKNRRKHTFKLVYSESGRFQFPFHFPVISNFSQFFDKISTDMYLCDTSLVVDIKYFQYLWWSNFLIIVSILWTSFTIYAPVMGSFTMKPWKTNKKKKYAKYQTAIEIFRNWKLFRKLTNSRQSRKGSGWQKEKHYFLFHFIQFICMSKLSSCCLADRTDGYFFVSLFIVLSKCQKLALVSRTISK